MDVVFQEELLPCCGCDVEACLFTLFLWFGHQLLHPRRWFFRMKIHIHGQRRSNRPQVKRVVVVGFFFTTKPPLNSSKPSRAINKIDQHHLVYLYSMTRPSYSVPDRQSTRCLRMQVASVVEEMDSSLSVVVPSSAGQKKQKKKQGAHANTKWPN